ncbi:MAG: hypothetical protein FH756_06050 [Firmicutes bacterium]|nr:hypothetical protein [Bacillota bacterium]
MPAPRTNNHQATWVFGAAPDRNQRLRKSKPQVESKEVILEDLDFAWRPSEQSRAVVMWNDGTNIPNMARELKRQQDEVLMLVVHLARRGKIESRQGGLLGKAIDLKCKTS